MPISPVLPTSGLTGWKFLNDSLETQEALFNRSPDIQREVDYFNENIGDVKTLDDFMGDRRLLNVALSSFGLAEEIDKGAFVRKILEEGTEDSDAFAVRLNNSEYLEMARVLDFSSGELSLSEDDISTITNSYQQETFEVALGDVDETMRLALNFQREIAELADLDLSEDAGWFRVMGSVPLLTVIESAFNMPSGFSSLDIDKQKDLLSDKANSLFGGKSIDIFKDPEVIESAVSRYLLQEQIASGPSANTPGFAALSLLQGGTGSSAIFNLLISNSG